jgi:hypothetical protein
MNSYLFIDLIFSFTKFFYMLIFSISMHGYLKLVHKWVIIFQYFLLKFVEKHAVIFIIIIIFS